jgi:hypothetical protein
MPELQRLLRDHARAIDEGFVPLDPVAIRARQDERIGELDGPLDDDHAPAALDGYGDEPPRDRRRRRTLALVAAIAVLAIVAGAVLVASGRRSSISTVDQPPVDGRRWIERSSMLIASDASGSDVAAVWTGHELVLVGQGIGPTDYTQKPMPLGAIPAYSPTTDSWRTYDAPPLPISAAQFRAVWTDSHVLVVGTPVDANGPDAAMVGASLDPTTGAWTTIATAPPGRAIAGAAVWTGDRMLTWEFARGVTSYDPSSDRWEVLTDERISGNQVPPRGPTDPPQINDAGADAVWNGSRMFVVDHTSPSVGSFDPATKSWMAVPDSPTVSMTRPRWTGQALVVGNGRSASWWHPGDTDWSTAPEAPGWTGDPGSPAVAISDRLITWASHAGANPSSTDPGRTMSLDLSSGTWSDLGAAPSSLPPSRDAIVAGDEVIIWGAGGGKLQIATIPRSALSHVPSTPVSVPPEPQPPAGVGAGELEQLSMGTHDQERVFTPYRAADAGAAVIAGGPARARAAQSLVDQGVVSSAPSGDAVALGHLRTLASSSHPGSDTLSWLVTFREVPTGAGRTDLLVYLDARTGDPLLVEAWPPAGG